MKKNCHIPVHPGQVLQDILRESGFTQIDLARHLGVAQGKINEICRGKRGISPLMAVKLARAFKQSPELWLGLQQEWELSQVDMSQADDISPLKLRA